MDECLLSVAVVAPSFDIDGAGVTASTAHLLAVVVQFVQRGDEVVAANRRIENVRPPSRGNAEPLGEESRSAVKMKMTMMTRGPNAANQDVAPWLALGSFASSIGGKWRASAPPTKPRERVRCKDCAVNTRKAAQLAAAQPASYFSRRQSLAACV